MTESYAKGTDKVSQKEKVRGKEAFFPSFLINLCLVLFGCVFLLLIVCFALVLNVVWPMLVNHRITKAEKDL